MMKPPLLIDTTTPVGRLASAFSSVLLLDGQIAASKRAAEEGLKAAKRAGDVLGEANLQKMLGVIVTQKRTRNIVAARERYVEAYSLYKSASCILGQAVSQAAIGYVFVKTESYAKARGCYQRALSQFRKAQHLEGQYNCHQWLGVIHRKLGHRNDLLANTLQKSKSLACFRAAQRVLSILKRTKRFVFKWHGNDLSLHMRYVLANNSRPTLPSSSSSSSSTSIKGKSKLGADGGGGGANNSCNNFLLSSGGSSHGSVSAGGGGGGNKKKKKKTTTTTTSTAGTMTNKGSSLGRRLLYERQRKESFSGLNQGSSSSSSGSNPTSGGGGAISAISRRHHNKRPPPTPTPRSDLSKTFSSPPSSTSHQNHHRNNAFAVQHRPDAGTSLSKSARLSGGESSLPQATEGIVLSKQQPQLLPDEAVGDGGEKEGKRTTNSKLRKKKATCRNEKMILRQMLNEQRNDDDSSDRVDDDLKDDVCSTTISSSNNRKKHQQHKPTTTSTTSFSSPAKEGYVRSPWNTNDDASMISSNGTTTTTTSSSSRRTSCIMNKSSWHVKTISLSEGNI